MSVTAQDILNDIEFEIMQGMVSRDDLGKSLRAVQQFQNKARSETFEALRPTATNREIVTRQFQINDMLITLLQEMAAAIREIQRASRRTAQVPRSVQPTGTTTRMPLAKGDAGQSIEASVLGDDLYGSLLTEIENATEPDALQVDFQPRSISLPIVGWFITRARAYLHRLALFYVRQFANRQGPINQTFAEWILQTSELIQDRNEQIRALREQLAVLEARLTESAKSASSSDGKNVAR
jgi:hypothetical protein